MLARYYKCGHFKACERCNGVPVVAPGGLWGISGLERLLKWCDQLGIMLKQQRRCEEQHSLNHRVC